MDVVRALGIDALDNAWITSYTDHENGRIRLKRRSLDTWLLSLGGGTLYTPAQEILNTLESLGHIPKDVSNGSMTLQELLDLLDYLETVEGATSHPVAAILPAP